MLFWDCSRASIYILNNIWESALLRGTKNFPLMLRNVTPCDAGRSERRACLGVVRIVFISSCSFIRGVSGEDVTGECIDSPLRDFQQRLP